MGTRRPGGLRPAGAFVRAVAHDRAHAHDRSVRRCWASRGMRVACDEGVPKKENVRNRYSHGQLDAVPMEPTHAVSPQRRLMVAYLRRAWHDLFAPKHAAEVLAWAELERDDPAAIGFPDLCAALQLDEDAARGRFRRTYNSLYPLTPSPQP